MVRAKAAEVAEKKAVPARKTAAAAKTATPEKKDVPAKEETSAEEIAGEVPAADVEAAAEGDETVEEHAEGGEGEEHAEGEEGGEGKDAAGKPKFERTPPTEEDLAYIKELLETKVKLTDDSEVQLFSYGPPKVGAESFVRHVVCHLCRGANMQKMAGIKAHLEGKRHKENLKRKSLNNGERYKQPYLLFYSREDNKVKQFKIFPGENIENVTPEYEDRIVDKAEWEMKKIEDENLLKLLSEDRIYDYNKIRPVIGLDYLVKMKHKGKMRTYCVLCEEFMVPDTYQHVVDIKHQATYIIKHFPKLYEKVSEGLTIKHQGAKENCLRNIFRKLYRKIEIKHGFKKMLPVDSGDFLTLRPRYINKIRKMPHYSEETITFTDGEVNVLIKKCNNNVPFNEPDPPTQPLPDAPAAGGRKRRGDVIQNETMSKNRRVAPVGGPNVGPHGGAPVHDLQRSWGVYRSVKNKRMDRLMAQYKRYEKDGKQHPSYQQEWSRFWNRRCDELKKENINTETYNFDKEWLPLWERRLRKLYHKDVSDRRTALRQKFNLPLRGRTPEPSGPPNSAVNMRQLNEMVNMISSQSMMGPGPMMGNSGNFGPPMPNMNTMNMNSFVPPQYGNQQNSNNYGRGGNMGGGIGGGPNQGGPRGGGRQRNVQQQPLQQQNQRPQQQQNQRPPQLLQQQQQPPQQQSRKRPAPRVAREPVSVITALRLLTALEDQLGSLGPKSVQLLGKAVLCEKNKQNLNDLLADNEYYMFFATAKEKLKGQILANVVDPSKISPVNSTIEDLTQIIKLMDKESNNRGGGVGGGRNQNANSGGGRNQNVANVGGGRNQNAGNGGGGRNQNANNGGAGRNQNANNGGAGRNQNANNGGAGRNQKANNNGGGRTGGGRNQNANNSGGGGDNFGRNMGGNDQFAGNNGNFGNNGGNFRNDDGNFGGNDNFRANNDGGNYRGGFNSDNANNRMNSNLDSGNNYRGSNDGGNYRNDSGNFSNSNLAGGNNYRANNDDNFRGGVGDGGNYRSNSSGGGNYGGGANTNNSNSLSNYRGNDNGNFGSGTASFGSGTGNNGGNSGLSSNFSSSTNQYRSGGNFGNNDNFNSKQASNFGSAGGNWMGGSGSVYSSNNSKLSSNTPAFSSGLGGGNNSLSSFGNNRNTSNFGSGGGGGGNNNNSGNFRRYN